MESFSVSVTTKLITFLLIFSSSTAYASTAYTETRNSNPTSPFAVLLASKLPARFVFDKRHSDICKWAIKQQKNNKEQLPSAALIKWKLHQHGVADEKLLPFYVNSNTNNHEEIATHLIKEMSQLGSDQRVSWGTYEKSNDFCVITSYSKLKIQPFKRVYKPRESLHFEATLQEPFHQVVAYLSTKNHHVFRTQVKRPAHDRISIDAGRPAQKGLYQFEIIGTGATGEVVLLNVPIEWGKIKKSRIPNWMKKIPKQFLPHYKSSEHLLQLVNRERKKAHIAPLQVSPQLADLADSYAHVMGEQNRVQHVDKEGNTPAQRMRNANIDFKHMGENIALGSHIWEIHHILMQSPAHKAAILDKHFTHIGLGIYELQRPHSQPLLYVAQEFAAFQPHLSIQELHDQMIKTVDKYRKQAKQSLLTNDSKLNAIANSHSHAMASTQDFSYKTNTESVGIFEQTQVLYPRAANIAADIFILNNVDQIERSQYLLGDFNRFGFGLIKADSEKYGRQRLWITLIFVKE